MKFYHLPEEAFLVLEKFLLSFYCWRTQTKQKAKKKNTKFYTQINVKLFIVLCCLGSITEGTISLSLNFPPHKQLNNRKTLLCFAPFVFSTLLLYRYKSESQLLHVSFIYILGVSVIYVVCVRSMSWVLCAKWRIPEVVLIAWTVNIGIIYLLIWEWRMELFQLTYVAVQARTNEWKVKF